MPHTLAQLTGEPIWLITLFGHLEDKQLEHLLGEAVIQIKGMNSASGMMVDWRQAEPLPKETAATLVELIGTWIVTLPISPPVFFVFLCHDASVKIIAQTLEHAGIMLPIFDNPEEGFTYLSLKIASSQVKDNILNSQTMNVDPAFRLELIAAANEILEQPLNTGEEGDETSKFPMRGVLRLEAAGMDKSILVFPEKGGVLGRRDSKGEKPDVDLSLWSGFHSGVSRRHAEVIVGGDGVLYLQDLASTNGTYLNGVRLRAHHRYPIQHGDEVRLGSLIMHIYFQSVGKDE